MSQPVKLSDALVLNARIAGEVLERSIAGQVEFWAGLGRSVESLLEGRQVVALKRAGTAEPISQALASVETAEGRRRLQEVLAHRPYPHFEQASGRPGLLLRIDADGSRTVGRFVNRRFVLAEPAGRQTGAPSVRRVSKTVKQKPGPRPKEEGHRKHKAIAIATGRKERTSR